MGAAYLRAPQVQSVDSRERSPGCTGKVAFSTRPEARLGAKALRNTNAKPYACRFCGQWHVGRGIISPGKKPKSIEGINGA
jgi:hypothetical protein